MTKSMKIIFTIGLLLVANGCAIKPMSSVYSPALAIYEQPKLQSIIVLKPDDERRPIRSPGYNRDVELLTLCIPLMPYYHRQIKPEMAYGFVKYDFPYDLGKVVASDLAASGICQEVSYSVDMKTVEPVTAGTHYLKVTLNKNIWERYSTTYGLSIIGDFLWVIGAPMSYGHVELSVTAELLDHNRKSIANETFTGEASLTEWYPIFGQQNRVPQSISAAYGCISPKLREFVAKNAISDK
jgi:hypothetical protein